MGRLTAQLMLTVSLSCLFVCASHDRILEALTVNGEINGMQRFELIVSALKKTDNPALQVCVCVCVCTCVCLLV